VNASEIRVLPVISVSRGIIYRFSFTPGSERGDRGIKRAIGLESAFRRKQTPPKGGTPNEVDLGFHSIKIKWVAIDTSVFFGALLCFLKFLFQQTLPIF
jgi:hypothetical protein